jgi:hypothetical protein
MAPLEASFVHVVTITIAMLVCLQVKHFIADYLLQPKWILTAKKDLRRSGGYVHAGIHAVGSIPALLIAGLAVKEIAAFVVAEFVIHYVIDFWKAWMSGRSSAGPNHHAYWAMHGFDQLLHQLTYAAIVFFAQMLVLGG